MGATSRAALAAAVRTANVVIAGVGGVMLGYGGYLATRFPSNDVVWGAVIGLGALELVLSGALLCCAYKSLFALRLYGLIVGALTLAEAAIAIMFWAPDTQARVINVANLPPDLHDELVGHLVVAGIALTAVVGFQSFTLALTACQCSAVDPLNQGLLDDDAALPRQSDRGRKGEGQALLRDAKGPGGSSSRGKGGRGDAEMGGRGQDGEEGDAEAAAVASGRYKKGKHAAMYEKYGVR